MNVATRINMARPGRVCPADYAYDPAILSRPAEIGCDTLYVVGGLYGNLEALDALEQLVARDSGPVKIIFNGDFHWFDADPAWFAEIERRTASRLALRGNIETELAREGNPGIGCGCAYPEVVDDGTVQRSNDILTRLKAIAAGDPDTAARLAGLPMHIVAQVGTLRVAIVHGDATALAGWRFDVTALDEPRNLGWLDDVRRLSKIDIFASTHTCLPALRNFDVAAGRMTIINNGAAGMPNFSKTSFGIVSRISVHPSPHAPLYGLRRSGVNVDAIALPYDAKRFAQRFLTAWPPKSAAHQSYFNRIASGPDYAVARARPTRPSNAA